MRRLLIIPASAVVPVLLAAQTPAELTAAAETITADAVAAHVRVIADDSMMGRDTPSPGLEQTAQYVAEQFKALGLKPAGGNGSWFQRYPIPPQLDFAKSQIVFSSGDKRVAAGFTTAARLAGRTVPSRNVPAGAVLVAGHQQASAISPRALANKVVLYVPQAGMDPATEQKLLNRLQLASRGVVIVSNLDSADFAERVHTALQQSDVNTGLRGVAIVDSADFSERVHTALQQSDVNTGLQWSARVRPEAVSGLREMLAASGVDLARARTDTTPIVRDLPSLQIDFEPQFRVGENDNATAPNVVAVLEGGDSLLRKEHVLFVAHMDHTGIHHGQPDSIANGADDNASGVAGLIALAKAFSQPGARPARSIVFLATSGGAKNFWGSREFANQASALNSLGGGLFGGLLRIVLGGGSPSQRLIPIVLDGQGGQGAIQLSVGNGGAQAPPPPPTPPAANGGKGNRNVVKDSDAVIVLGGPRNAPGAGDGGLGSNSIAVSHIVGVINLDMIGRHAGDSVVVDGMNDLDLPTPLTWLAAAHPELKLTVVDGGTVANTASDHYPFVKEAMPSLYFHNGSHDRPTAESASAIDADLASRILRLVFYVGEDVANGKRPPQWSSEGRQHYLGMVQQER